MTKADSCGRQWPIIGQLRLAIQPSRRRLSAVAPIATVIIAMRRTQPCANRDRRTCKQATNEPSDYFVNQNVTGNE